MKIVFATNNEHKLSEIRAILGQKVEVLSLKDIGCTDEIPETGTTLDANAEQKARYIFDRYGLDVFADDTGLEVEALDGAPGVYTARYAALPDERTTEGVATVEPIAHPDPEDNIRKLLRVLSGEQNRRARFRTVIALIRKKDLCPCGCMTEAELTKFEGIVDGYITTEKQGIDGFGYDPIFQPEGYGKTFAELGVDVKNTISHRARATKKLAEFLIIKL